MEQQASQLVTRAFSHPTLSPNRAGNAIQKHQTLGLLKGAIPLNQSDLGNFNTSSHINLAADLADSGVESEMSTSDR